MRNKLPRNTTKSIGPFNPYSMDTILEEYTSKLEQKVVAQSQQLKTITDNATSCLFMIDVNGRPTFMNPSAEHVTGYTLAEIKDKTLHKIMHHTHRVKIPQSKNKCSITAALRKMNHVRDQEDILVRKDGSFFPISFSVAPLQEDGTPKGAVLEFQDITKRKELEKQKDDFIGVASHELKTPVTSMKTFTQVLQRKFEKGGDKIAAETMGKIDVQINRLTALISDLLDVTQSQAGKLNFRPEKIDIDDMIHEVVENMELTTTRHSIIVEGDTHINIVADKNRTSQVLINFISNAIKYSPHGKKIVIRVEHNKKELIVSVQDFGIGVPSDKLDEVFNRFMRVSGPGMETFGGLGLGLYISSQIITRQGGRVWAESKEKNGSTFYFSLPFKPKKV